MHFFTLKMVINYRKYIGYKANTKQPLRTPPHCLIHQCSQTNGNLNYCAEKNKDTDSIFFLSEFLQIKTSYRKLLSDGLLAFCSLD